jgi:hypothetical protein
VFGKLIAVQTIGVLEEIRLLVRVVINDSFDWNSCEACVGEQDGERRFVLVEFVLGNGRIVEQALNTKSLDHLSLRHS